MIEHIGEEVQKIYVIDDACPDGSGLLVEEKSRDKRITVVFHSLNRGVGGAVITGYRIALEEGAEIVVKLDGDGQMDPSLIPTLVAPILAGEADYAKGNRFENLDSLISMPKVRVFGNAVLSLWTKFSSGYWSVTDPTNGYTAIHRSALEKLNLDKLRESYFFESDMLFRLNISGCVVRDVPMDSVYAEEQSNLRIHKVLLEFPARHAVNLVKRIFYRYYLREWNIGSFELPLGLALVAIGGWFGLSSYLSATAIGVATTAGQATGSALALILGVQMLLSFLAYDVQAEPRTVIHRR